MYNTKSVTEQVRNTTEEGKIPSKRRGKFKIQYRRIYYEEGKSYNMQSQIKCKFIHIVYSNVTKKISKARRGPGDWNATWKVQAQHSHISIRAHFGPYSPLHLPHGGQGRPGASLPPCYHHQHCLSLPSGHCVSLHHADLFFHPRPHILHYVQMGWELCNSSWIPSSPAVFVLSGRILHSVLWSDHRNNRWKEHRVSPWPMRRHFLRNLIGSHCQPDYLYGPNEVVEHIRDEQVQLNTETTASGVHQCSLDLVHLWAGNLEISKWLRYLRCHCGVEFRHDQLIMGDDHGFRMEALQCGTQN